MHRRVGYHRAKRHGMPWEKSCESPVCAPPPGKALKEPTNKAQPKRRYALQVLRCVCSLPTLSRESLCRARPVAPPKLTSQTPTACARSPAADSPFPHRPKRAIKCARRSSQAMGPKFIYQLTMGRLRMVAPALFRPWTLRDRLRHSDRRTRAPRSSDLILNTKWRDRG